MLRPSLKRTLESCDVSECNLPLALVCVLSRPCPAIQEQERRLQQITWPLLTQHAKELEKYCIRNMPKSLMQQIETHLPRAQKIEKTEINLNLQPKFNQILKQVFKAILETQTMFEHEEQKTQFLVQCLATSQIIMLQDSIKEGLIKKSISLITLPSDEYVPSFKDINLEKWHTC